MDFWKTFLFCAFVKIWQPKKSDLHQLLMSYEALAQIKNLLLSLWRRQFMELYIVACGKFISWSRTWRQSLSTLEAALVWTLSTFDGVLNVFEKGPFFFDLDLLRWRRNNRMAACLWDDSYLSFVDVFQTEYFSCALLFAARIFVEAGVLAKLMALLISYPLMRGKSLVQASPGGC